MSYVCIFNIMLRAIATDDKDVPLKFSYKRATKSFTDKYTAAVAINIAIPIAMEVALSIAITIIAMEVVLQKLTSSAYTFKLA